MENGQALVNGLAALMELAGGVGFSVGGISLVWFWFCDYFYLDRLDKISVVRGKCTKVKRVLQYTGLLVE